MKKLLSALLVMMMLVACMAPALADEGSEPDWTHYDELIAEIKTTTDLEEREALMHQAEDMLMETSAILPIYYYNDPFMLDSAVTNVYSNLFGYKFFMYANKEGDTTLRACLASEPDKLDPALNRHRGRRHAGRELLLRSVHLRRRRSARARPGHRLHHE